MEVQLTAMAMEVAYIQMKTRLSVSATQVLLMRVMHIAVNALIQCLNTPTATKLDSGSSIMEAMTVIDFLLKFQPTFTRVRMELTLYRTKMLTLYGTICIVY